MEPNRFAYQYEKFAQARRLLMVPHPKGEAESFAAASRECSLALHHFDVDQVDDEARRWIAIVKGCIDTTGVQDPSGRGTGIVKAEQLLDEEKGKFSHAVDDLASWFGMRC